MDKTFGGRAVKFYNTLGDRWYVYDKEFADYCTAYMFNSIIGVFVSSNRVSRKVRESTQIALLKNLEHK